jgi:hypothetical protein
MEEGLQRKTLNALSVESVDAVDFVDNGCDDEALFR